MEKVMVVGKHIERAPYQIEDKSYVSIQLRGTDGSYGSYSIEGSGKDIKVNYPKVSLNLLYMTQIGNTLFVKFDENKRISEVSGAPFVDLFTNYTCNFVDYSKQYDYQYFVALFYEEENGESGYWDEKVVPTTLPAKILQIQKTLVELSGELGFKLGAVNVSRSDVPYMDSFHQMKYHSDWVYVHGRPPYPSIAVYNQMKPIRDVNIKEDISKETLRKMVKL